MVNSRQLSQSRLNSERPRIGWREWAGLPELGVIRVKAKVDTGARSSTLHAFDIEVLPLRRVVRFKVHPLQGAGKPEISCEAPLLEQRWIRSSNGKRDLRPVIRTELELGGERWSIDLTLTSRDEMGFRMLLGREAIRKRFVVDPACSFLVRELVPKGSKPKKKQTASR